MNKPDFVYVTYIEAPPQRVWEALFDSELTKQYWGMHKNVSDWKVGSRWAHEDYDSGVATVAGEVLEIEPPRRLVFTWEHPGSDEPPSRVTLMVEPFMETSRLTVIHAGLSGKHEAAAIAGWPAILSSLKTLLETGKALAMTTRRWGGSPPPASR